MVGLAGAFGLRVTGEGVETEDQAARLRALRCDRGQGYLFARPLPAAAFEARLLAPTAALADAERIAA